MEQVKLERLFMTEVSGVDDPANQLPGFMVYKSAGGASVDLLLVLANEMEAVTKATDSKQPYGDVTYADPGYQKDGKKRYPLDTETHIRAAWSYINQADNAELYSAEQISSIKGKIKAAMKRIGAEVEGDTKKTNSENIVAKIRGILLGATPTEQEGIDMEKDELVTILSESAAAQAEVIAKAVAEAVTKSLTPAEGEGATSETVPAVETAALSAEQLAEVAKAVEAALAPYNEIFEKVLDRLEGTEKHLGIAARKSLDGQESGEGEGEPVIKSTPDLGDAIRGALTRGARS